MRSAIGIDIGGTAIKLGLVASDGRVLARRQFPFDRALGFEALADAIATAAKAVATGHAAVGVGISTPGYADRRDGTLIDGTANVPALAGRSLPAALGSRLGLPAVIENDGTAATLAELRFGAGKAFRRFALIAIGTGIGGGIAIDGRVVTGNAGEPPELGAMVLDAEGERNYSSLPGTFEHLAAADGFLAAHRRLSPADPAPSVAALFQRDDAAAAAAIDATARRIAQALGSMINLLNLEACLLGGGVSEAGASLLDAVGRHLPDFTWPLLLARCRLLPAALGNDAGLVGAAALALDQARSTEPGQA
ncbi:glucokinase [Stella humosa]|uniref:Glucokinase n=1 Tax=Stella humosa TaxID=94 RepID=A0A3N1KLK8_9PROT|nr:ROK family protein [Stella humosa]ROP81254.1 glucokinase [Stella humosa]BBK32602.1 glucokinase [Stella humosa]